MPFIRIAILPHIEFRWTASALTGTFVRFSIYRRLVSVAGVGPYVRIATIASITNRVYRDYAVISRETYQYTVTQTETIGADTIEGAFAAPVVGRVIFDYAYLHAVANPSTYYVQLGASDITEDVQQDVTTHVAWGRAQPTAFIGDADYSRLRIAGLDDVQRGRVWEMLRALIALQPAAAAMFCLRIGVSGQRFFVNLEAISRRGGQASYLPDVAAVETFFTEAIPVS